jgi:hypothetical protein
LLDARSEGQKKAARTAIERNSRLPPLKEQDPAFSLTRMSRFQSSLSLAAAAMATLFATTASANGRFPRAQRLIEHPTDPNKLYIAATYGLLLTTDRGMNWYHVCEAAFAFDPKYPGDPVLSLTGNGWLLTATQASMNLSTDQGCDWKQTLSSPSMMQSFWDFTVAPSGAHPIVAVSTTYGGASGPVNEIQESTDNGMTWKVVGMPLPLAVVNTVDVDPTDPTHIYATGLSTIPADTPDTGRFVVSMNHGMSWTTYKIPNTYGWANPFICGVHPTDPKKIFVRTDAWKDRLNVQTADDALLYSDDGGQTWTELLHAGGPMDDSPGAKLFGFALSPDGSTVLAGYGDPVDGSRLVESSWFGVYKSSSDGKYSFGADTANPKPMMAKEAISCITWTKNGIYVCVSPQGESSFLSFAKDPTFTSRAQMTTLMKLSETKGVPPGCSGRATSTCSWAVDCAALGACPDGGATTGTGGASGAGGATSSSATTSTSTSTSATTSTSSTTSSSAGGAGGSGATGSATTTTTTSGAGGRAGSGGSPEKPKSCNCRAPGASTAGTWQAAGWLFGLWLVRARRRSRTTSLTV